METFNRIADLLDETRRIEEVRSMMIQSGAMLRTNAGVNFFIQCNAQLYLAYLKLSSYPPHWIQGVKTVLEIREKNIKGRVPVL